MSARPGPIDPLSEVIVSDRVCRGCGYALKGLKKSGVCPECAMPILAPKWAHDPMANLPPGEIRPRRLGAWFASTAMVVMVAAVGVEASEIWRDGVGLAFFPLAACFWVAGIFMLTRASHLPHAAMHGFSPRGRLRKWARWLQPAIVLGGTVATLIAAGVVGPSAMPLAQMTVGVCALIALVGLVLAALACERLADWVRDDSAQRLFVAFTGGLPLAAGIAVVGLTILRSFSVVLFGVALLVALASFAIFPIALLQLTRSLTYAVTHAEDHADLEGHRERQRRRDADVAAARVRAGDRLQSRP